MKHVKNRVLVTGATGFIGSNLLKKLHGKYEVAILARENSDLSRISGMYASVFKGDITDRKSVENAMKGCNAVMHLAACVRSGDERLNRTVNVEGTRNVIDACKISGVKDIVYLSTVNVLATAKGAYGRTKEEAEALVMSSGLRARVIMPTLVYGKGGKEFEKLVGLTDRLIVPIAGNGCNRIQPAYIDDVTETIMKAITAKPGIYGIAGPEPITFRRFLELIGEARGKRNVFIPIPMAVLRIGNLMTRTLTEEQILGFSQDRILDPSFTKSELGVKLTEYKEGLTKALK